MSFILFICAIINITKYLRYTYIVYKLYNKNNNTSLVCKVYIIHIYNKLIIRNTKVMELINSCNNCLKVII